MHKLKSSPPLTTLYYRSKGYVAVDQNSLMMSICVSLLIKITDAQHSETEDMNTDMITDTNADTTTAVLDQVLFEDIYQKVVIDFVKLVCRTPFLVIFSKVNVF